MIKPPLNFETVPNLHYKSNHFNGANKIYLLICIYFYRYYVFIYIF